MNYNYTATVFLAFACCVLPVHADPNAELDHESKEARLDKALNTPVSIWGQVVDQDGTPIQGALVKLNLMDKIEWDELDEPSSDYKVISDDKGRFKLLDKRGAMASVEVEKHGYATAYDSETHRSLSLKSVYYAFGKKQKKSIPTEGSPLVLVLRKKGEVADLRKINPQKFAIPKDGDEAELAIKHTPVRIGVSCWSSAPLAETYDRYDWRAEVKVKKGKLQPVKNQYAVMAPEKGYEEAIKINMMSDFKGDWSWSSPPEAHDFWVKLDNGTFAKLEIDITTGEEHAVMVSGLLNLDGNNSFEK